MVKEVYKTYPEEWFLKATFDDLLGWNRWWHRSRNIEGLLSYGSSPADYAFNVPVFAYQVSGEYSLIKNAINRNIIHEDSIYECLMSLKRAGASAIVTYFAEEVAQKLR